VVNPEQQDEAGRLLSLILTDPFSQAQIVDVRSEAEFERGHIPGAVNIPLDSLRGRLHELSRQREIWLVCGVGLRAYNATRILQLKIIMSFMLVAQVIARQSMRLPLAPDAIVSFLPHVNVAAVLAAGGLKVPVVVSALPLTPNGNYTDFWSAAARAHCGDCGHDFLIAFSGKGRGVCPSRNTRRRAQTAAHLVDHVLPRLPVRQGDVVDAQFLEEADETVGHGVLLILADFNKARSTTALPGSKTVRYRPGYWPWIRFAVMISAIRVSAPASSD